MSIIRKIKQGEAQTVTFIVKDEDLNLVDCSTTTCFFWLKVKKGDTIKIIDKVDVDFDKTNAEDGELKIFLSSTETDIDSKVYYGQLTVQFNANSIKKFDDLLLVVEEEV